jgi:acetyl-CoA/propionyl-CoA carboxylase biotin carboxyl carrier protein
VTRAIGRLYIANRGEIAARIGRTAAALGMDAVAPPTDGPDAVDLLDAAAVIADARRVEADAVHPGYGFLAESAAFADAVVAAGLRWVGPPASAIRALGDKAAARRLASSLGVPTLAGYDDTNQSDTTLRAAAERIGLPVIVKPSAGGGGKGMHVVRTIDAFDEAISAARREARTAFGDDLLILERFVEGPRHVEIQVLFDEQGHGVHLGERDCSLQRRHQKILEEAPSPAVDPRLREAMGAAALRLAGAVGYASAGTVEFLLDDRGTFSFLEMNTRLQVEHPVTELVTGRDLVADQLHIAEGRPLALLEEEVRIDGHAVEVRLYAEDAENGFLPATGRIEALEWPVGDGIRVDAGVALGDDVGGRFDPMLAKLIAFGGTRDEAFDRLADALDETVVLGLVTNLRFLRWVVAQPFVRDGQVRIDTLERFWPPAGWAASMAPPDGVWALAARELSGAGAPAGGTWAGGWRLNAPATLRVSSEDETRNVEPVADAMRATFVRVDDRVFVDVGGRSVPFRRATPPDVDAAARGGSRRGAGSAEIAAPMPGTVLAVHVRPGDAVEPGDRLVTLEAMKMEHVVSAMAAATVADVAAEPGAQVTRGEVLVVLSGPAAAPDATAPRE